MKVGDTIRLKEDNPWGTDGIKGEIGKVTFVSDEFEDFNFELFGKYQVWFGCAKDTHLYEILNPDEKSNGTHGTKHDTGKPQLSLVPRVALEEEAAVMEFGAAKYGRYNYKKGFEYSRLIDAALRHIQAFNDGEDLDPESGKSHLAHARCCLGMLMDIINLGTAKDNRYKKGAA